MFETIDFSKSEQYTLSIRLSTDGFSFSIYNPLQESTEDLLDWEVEPSLSLTANLKTCFRELPFLSYTYKQVSIIVPGKRFTLVPLEQFEDDQAELLFYYTHTKIANEIVLYNILKKNNTVVVFGMDRSTYTFLTEHMRHIEFFAQATPMLERNQSKSRFGNNRKLYAHMRPESLSIYAFDNGKLLLVNSFDCTNTPDRVYYLLYVWKQLEFDQLKDELHVSGAIDKEALHESLSKFIRHLFVSTSDRNIDLDTLSACE